MHTRERDQQSPETHSTMEEQGARGTAGKLTGRLLVSAAVILSASSAASLASAVLPEAASGHVAALSATLKDASLSTQEIAELTDQVHAQVHHPVVRKLLIARLEETTALRGPDGRMSSHSKSSHSKSSHSKTAIRRA